MTDNPSPSPSLQPSGFLKAINAVAVGPDGDDDMSWTPWIYAEPKWFATERDGEIVERPLPCNMTIRVYKKKNSSLWQGMADYIPFTITVGDRSPVWRFVENEKRPK